MNNGQLEMSFEMGHNCRGPERRGRRQKRAQWWFERMRRVVDRAMDWEPAPIARPEQTWFAGCHRQVSVAALPGLSRTDGACEVCE